MTRAYSVKGTTSEVTTCELCGRDELRGTVVMQPLDADGNPDGDPAYFGTSCAAKAAGWTQRQVTARATAADQAERERRFEERETARRAESTWLDTWYLQRYGTTDARAAAKTTGVPFRVINDLAFNALRDYRAAHSAA